MQWASLNGKRVEATPKTTATCPACDGEVRAKCGELVVWHWAHKVADCDAWGEPESKWHRDWKNRFPKEWQERVMGGHRADVLTPQGVIEFQKSYISGADIQEREKHYPNLIWVLDASNWSISRLGASHPNRLPLRHGANVSFFWHNPKRRWLDASCPLYLDFGPCSHHVYLAKFAPYYYRSVRFDATVLTKDRFALERSCIEGARTPRLPSQSSFGVNELREWALRVRGKIDELKERINATEQADLESRLSEIRSAKKRQEQERHDSIFSGPLFQLR